MSIFTSIGSVISSCVSSITSLTNKLGGGFSEVAKFITGPNLFPTLELLEIGIRVIGAVVQVLSEYFGLTEIEEKPEEIGLKAEKAESQGVKPENFESYSEYIEYIRSQVVLDNEELDNLSEADRLKYNCVGSVILIKGIEEKEGIDISPEFLISIGNQGVSKETIIEIVEKFKAEKLELSEYSKYFKSDLDEVKYEKVGNAIEEAIKTVNPGYTEKEVLEEMDKYRDVE